MPREIGEVQNLGEKKTSHGLEAIEMYRRGEMERLKEYCMQDVKITKKIFDLIRNQGYLWIPERGRPQMTKVELVFEEKAVSHLLTNDEIAQVITYLCALELDVGLLINFGRNRLEYKRIFPPKDISRWRERIHRYLWTPKDHLSANPLAHPLTDSRSPQTRDRYHTQPNAQTPNHLSVNPLFHPLTAHD